MAADPVRSRLGRAPLARGARRPGPHRRAHRGLDHGVRHRRGAAVDQHGRARPHRRVDPRLRHAGAAADAPARDPRGRPGVVPALLRARRRQRPGQPRRTRAERDGDDWVVTGQKVWCSNGRVADRGILLARTDPDAPRHAGISFFLVDMALARHRGPAAAPDDRRQRVRRGVPRRGAPARRRAARPAARRVGRGDGHAHQRARLHRLRRHLPRPPARRHRRARRRRRRGDPRPAGRARRPVAARCRRWGGGRVRWRRWPPAWPSSASRS